MEAKYAEYVKIVTATQPAECLPMTYEHWLAATKRQEAEAAGHAAAMRRWN